MEIPGRTLMDFVVDVAPDELGIAPERLFGQRKKAKKAGSEKLGMTLKEAVTRLGRFSHPEVLILR
jgi:hypothetical protein